MSKQKTKKKIKNKSHTIVDALTRKSSGPMKDKREKGGTKNEQRELLEIAEEEHEFDI